MKAQDCLQGKNRRAPVDNCAREGTEPSVGDHHRIQDVNRTAWEELQSGRHLISGHAGEPWDVCFARVSTEDQARFGTSLPIQISSAFSLAARQERKIAAVYLDPGQSASKLTFDDRPGIRQLMEDIKRKKVRHVFVYKRDRIARKAMEWILFLKNCLSNGVKIVFTSPDEPPVGSGAYATFTETVIIASAELESNILRMRMRDNILGRFQKGKWTTGPLPYGLTWSQDRTIVEDPTEGPVVKEIFRIASEEMLGAIRIADALNQKFPGSRRGRKWDQDSVLKVLRKRIYCGYLTLEATIEENGMTKQECLEQKSDELPCLVTEDAWNRAAEYRRLRQWKKDAEDPDSRYRMSDNLLLGILRCGCCNRPMTARHFVRRYKKVDGTISEYHSRYYCCRSGVTAKECSYRSSVRAHLIEDTVITVCNEHLFTMELPEIMSRAQAFRESQIRDLREQHSSVSAQVRDTAGAITVTQGSLERSNMDREIRYYEKRLSHLLEQREVQEQLLVQLQQLIEQSLKLNLDEQKVLAALEDWPERFRQADPDAKRMMLCDALDSVIWRPETRAVDVAFRFDPSTGSEIPESTVKKADRITPRPAGDVTLSDPTTDVLQNPVVCSQRVEFCITKPVPHSPAPLNPSPTGKLVANMKKAGRYLPASLPFGYVKDGRLARPDAVKSPLIRMVFGLASAGMPLSTIAHEINAAFGPNVRDKEWSRHSVRAVLFNPVYCGYQSLHGHNVLSLEECVQSQVILPVVTPEEWLAAQSVRRRVGSS